MLRLCGKWLSEVGFSIGEYVSGSCEDGKLIITPNIERAKIKEAEAMFIEREMKSLQKRFEQEKRKPHLKFVAAVRYIRNHDRWQLMGRLWSKNSKVGKNGFL